MPRIAATLALAWCLLGCGPVSLQPPPSGEPVELLTYDDRCHDQAAEGMLVPHRRHGTDISVLPSDIADDWPSGKAGLSDVPVQWPRGFTGVRLAGGEVAVLDTAGNVVATTGRNYRLRGGWMIGTIGFEFDAPTHVAAFLACGVVNPK